MKDWIYNAIKDCESIISESLHMAKLCKADKALDIHRACVKKIEKRCLAPQFPKKYREQVIAVLSFSWKREIENNIIYPVIFEGRLYLKWDSMPEACRELCLQSEHGPARGKVFLWDFEEGMKAGMNK